MKALILAAGFGVRLREIIHGRPKHLVSINGQPFLRHLLKLLKQKGFIEVILSIGYLSQYILDEFKHDQEGLKLTFSETQRPLGTAGSLKKAQSLLSEDFIVINGDTYLDIDYQKLLNQHQKSSALITIVGSNQHQQSGGLIIAKDNLVTDFISRSDQSFDEIKPNQGYIHSGVYAISPEVFQFIPPQIKYSLEKDLLPDLIAKKKVYLFKTNQKFIDIGTPADYQKALTQLK